MLKCRLGLCLKYVSIYARRSIDIETPMGIIEHKYELRCWNHKLRNWKTFGFIHTA
jgi:hypothetical protein